MRLPDIRREYIQNKLNRSELKENPIEQFGLWLSNAILEKLTDPTAMTLATVDEDGQPFQRIVLLKEVTEQGFVFFTNLASRKAQHTKKNNKVSLHFPWYSLDRQVHVTGKIEALTVAENIKYFVSRPRESQLAAWASKQSSRISTRGVLEGKYLELKQKFLNGDIPTPDFWGGYRVVPESIEFWQGRSNRLHDRFLYSKDGDRWCTERLAP